MGGTESLGISKEGQTVSARLKEFHIWHQLVSCLAVGFRKGTMAPVLLDARYFSFSHYAAGAFQDTTPVLELRSSESE